MKLYLHIGAEKTGSSAVQNWLHQNSEQLRERGVWYSEALGRPNNTGIHLYAGGIRDDQGFLVRGAITDEQKAEFIDKTKRDFIREVAAAKNAGCHSFVISNEHCHSRLINPQHIQRAADLLQPLFEQISIYLVIRPQLDMCLSLASTHARFGGKISRNWFQSQMRPGNHYYDYHGLLRKWAAIYGKGTIVPVPYKKNKDVIAYFAGQLGVDTAGFVAIPRVNEALDYRTIAIANALQFKMFRPDGKPNKNTAFFIDKLPVAEKLRLGLAFAQELQAGYQESNDALCAEWPQIEAEDLEVDWSSYDENGNLHKLRALDGFSPALTFIVERFNALNWLERARVKRAEAKVSELKSMPDKAIEQINEGLAYARTAMEIQSVAADAEHLIANLNTHKQSLLKKLPAPGK